MFTGIITTIGTVSKVIDHDGDMSFVIDIAEKSIDDLENGDSVCINGVCLTVIDKKINSIMVDVSSETLQCTNFSDCNSGSRVNIEKAMSATARFNGHLVSGHVDCVANIVLIEPEGRSKKLKIQLPEKYMKYVSRKGSICIDGVSLTVNEVSGTNISVNIIPHTVSNTIISDYVTGSKVNVEVDIIARYLESLIKPNQ